MLFTLMLFTQQLLWPKQLGIVWVYLLIFKQSAGIKSWNF